jgi:antitoxin component of RelBE/YafQ-DinJ toxin-antitoxin module
MSKSAKRMERIEFRASDAERQLVERLADQYNLTVSDLIRVLLKQATQRSPLLPNEQNLISKTQLHQLAELYRQLGAIHRVLHQTKLSNTASQTKATLAVEIALIDQLEELVKQIQKLIVQIVD